VTLLIDLGNSCCKFAIEEKGHIETYQSQKYGPFGKLNCIKSLCDQYDKAKSVIISSVLSEDMNTQIKDALTSGGEKNVYFLKTSDNNFGIDLAYINLSTLGVDRFAAMIGAKEKYTGSSCIVDIGTAVTIDAIDTNGVHQGGVIFPGVAGMKKALLKDTKIEADQMADVEYNVFANSTENAIHSGCMSALVGGVEYVVNVMAEKDAFEQIILTGGDAELIQSHLSMSVIIDNTLVLDGLRVVSQNM
jgi:type III pantothenate kinase